MRCCDDIQKIREAQEGILAELRTLNETLRLIAVNAELIPVEVVGIVATTGKAVPRVD